MAVEFHPQSLSKDVLALTTKVRLQSTGETCHIMQEECDGLLSNIQTFDKHNKYSQSANGTLSQDFD